MMHSNTTGRLPLDLYSVTGKHRVSSMSLVRGNTQFEGKTSFFR